MPLVKSASDDSFKANLKAELGAKRPRKQALAIAYSIQRRAKKAKGGPLMALPFSERSMMTGMKRSLEHQGMIHSPVPGRTDKIPMGVKSGSYVFPADSVSALGQGNSISGASALNKLFKMGPYGTQPGHMPHAGTPKLSAMKAVKLKADGGDASDASGSPVDIVAAGGEYVLPPEKVAEIGGGDLDHGHNILDAMVMHIRKKTIRTLKKLPRPKKN